jgi:hypothetical protein
VTPLLVLRDCSQDSGAGKLGPGSEQCSPARCTLVRCVLTAVLSLFDGLWEMGCGVGRLFMSLTD